MRQRACGDAWARGAPASAAPQLMRDSLGRTQTRQELMGLDAVALVIALEERFGIAIPDVDAVELRTPRHVIDYIYERIAHASDPTCLTQRAFYRVRRALVQVTGATRASVIRDARLEDVVPLSGRRRLWKALATATGVPAWPPLQRPSWVNIPLAVLPFAVSFGLAAIGDTGALPAILGGATALLLGVVSTRPLQLSVAGQWPTVGGVAQYLAMHSPAALLAPDVAWTREQVRQQVRATITDELGIGPDFDDGAEFVRDLGVH